MTNLILERPSTTKPISRRTILSLAEVALQTKEFRYIRQITLGWLAFYPGDLEVKLLYAQSLFELGKEQQSMDILEKIIQVDPEFIPALQLQYQVATKLGWMPNNLITSLFILTKSHQDKISDFPQAQIYRRAYQWLKDQDRPLATWEASTLGLPTGNDETDILSLGEIDSNYYQLQAVIQLRCLMLQNADQNAVRALAESYHSRWPDCASFILILAQNYMSSDPAKAVSLLHEAVAVDTNAQVAQRLWGIDFNFKKIWPTNLEVTPDHPTSPQAVPIPSSVAAVFGWNQLTPPDKQNRISDRKTNPNLDTLKGKSRKTKYTSGLYQSSAVRKSFTDQPYPIISELQQIAKTMNQPALSRIDGRYPVYVILSTQQGLMQQFGETSASLILEAMHRLADVVSKYRQWDSLVFLADQPDFGSKHSNLVLKPARAEDPWSIKLGLADLDAELSKQGEMIGAVLIVGGPEIIPFHHLPNPVDDTDMEIPSDNPYATRDENYFIAEWPVGRLPSGHSSSPEMLLKLLRDTTNYHDTNVMDRPWYSRFSDIFRNLIHQLPGTRSKNQKNYGYSAAVWRRASASVFRPIGNPHHLIVSPPTSVQETCAIRNPKKPCLKLPLGKLAYFNLHGLPDTDEWYGQRDPAEPGTDPDFPLALRAADIQSNGRTSPKVPEIIFSEACFGAHIIDKQIDEAIALKFLANGSKVVVGSTCISYGSIGTPLIAADLLGHTFWHYLKDGQPAGEALRRARIRLVKEMNQRQGYLDGEDQKTLLSFVYYGDPLIQINDLTRGPKTTMRSNKTQSSIPTVCDRIDESTYLQPISKEIMSQVKNFVSEYLPGMSDAQIQFSQKRISCVGTGHECPTSQLNLKQAKNQHIPERKVVTLSKTIHQDTHNHAQFARMTLDENGKLVKLVVSR